jgi:hypothetical protein
MIPLLIISWVCDHKEERDALLKNFYQLERSLGQEIQMS